MTHADVLFVIQAALSQRPAGQKVLVSAHEAAEIKILDYIEQVIGTVPVLTEGQVSTLAGIPIALPWTLPFSNSLYTFIINGFDASGAPVEINLVNKNPGYVTIKTFVASTVHAIAISHNSNL